MQKQVVDPDKNHVRRSIAMFMWSFIGFICLCLISQWLTVNRRDQVFIAYVNRVIQVGMKEHRGAKDVRALLLVKADDMSMTVRPDEIYVSGSGPTLRATVQYYADL